MRIVSALVARPLEVCWRVFTTPETLPRWVPGLQTARLVSFDVEGLPEEIQFEYAAGLRYSLRYSYDTEACVVRWEPASPEASAEASDVDETRGGVRGFARFTAVDGGTDVTYALEHDEGRKAAERALDDPRVLVEAFARFLHEDRY